MSLVRGDCGTHIFWQSRLKASRRGGIAASDALAEAGAVEAIRQCDNPLLSRQHRLSVPLPCCCSAILFCSLSARRMWCLLQFDTLSKSWQDVRGPSKQPKEERCERARKGQGDASTVRSESCVWFAGLLWTRLALVDTAVRQLVSTCKSF